MITDLDCEGRCEMTLTHSVTSLHTTTVRAYAATRVCYGVTGVTYCTNGKLVTWI